MIHHKNHTETGPSRLYYIQMKIAKFYFCARAIGGADIETRRIYKIIKIVLTFVPSGRVESNLKVGKVLACLTPSV